MSGRSLAIQPARRIERVPRAMRDGAQGIENMIDGGGVGLEIATENSSLSSLPSSSSFKRAASASTFEVTSKTR
ncbi:hypothetical protein [Stenotrophomonas maltophilia]|uniref:Uncharacterized protein n=1 Tax=Stenotrophomonas maltophilia TaxID=40324 RepID=A0AAI9FVN7_STEMA|nr:hypothetical protein [Stenotrophomonas maltophilia]EKT4093507.1 hypothetical protein [Stenotrophomonas maltophilia]HEL4101225.1 hypothetical protein [Stenotrophomonas maltophilia]HEL5044844.1 hypothetical protein [Stenotrophomonas maltophilia]